MPIYKLTATVVSLVEAENEEAAKRAFTWGEDGEARFSVEDMLSENREGASVGRDGLVSVEEIHPDNLRAELLAVGNDGSFFEPLGGQEEGGGAA